MLSFWGGHGEWGVEGVDGVIEQESEQLHPVNDMGRETGINLEEAAQNSGLGGGLQTTNKRERSMTTPL